MGVFIKDQCIYIQCFWLTFNPIFWSLDEIPAAKGGGGDPLEGGYKI